MRETIASLSRRALEGGELLRAALALLRDRLKLDGAWVHTCDPATLVWTSHVCTHDADAAPFAENEFLDVDFAKFAQLALRPDPVAVLSHETQGELARSARYRKLLQPFDLAHELRVALVAGGVCWGGLCVVRAEELGDFTAVERARIGELAPPVAEAIRAAALRAPPPAGDAPGPGTIVLAGGAAGGAGAVASLSPEAAYWLAKLGGSAGDLPHAVHAVAARTRACARGAPGPAPRAGVRGTDGRWIELHGSALQRPGDRASAHPCVASAPTDVAITIGAARPRTLAPLFVEAFELSSRERDVLALLLRGHTPDEIARRLVISRHTVRDHVKAIYAKAGVTSRPELSARLLALNIPAPPVARAA